MNVYDFDSTNPQKFIKRRPVVQKIEVELRKVKNGDEITDADIEKYLCGSETKKTFTSSPWSDENG